VICRNTEKGWFFITQPAHAWAAGQLAAAWDSEMLFTPVLKNEVTLATALHDVGWVEWDKTPRLHPDGHPVSFVEITFAETQQIWERAVSHVSLYNLYAALLVSMHAATIYRQRLERGADPNEQRMLTETSLNQHLQIQSDLITRLSKQSQYAADVEQLQLQANYRILRICDLLLLAICTGLTPFTAGEIPNVPGPSGELSHTINYKLNEDDHILSLNPYPFSQPELALSVYGRQINQKTFPDLPTYHAALKGANPEEIRWTIIPG
jgi:hypothetical protein